MYIKYFLYIIHIIKKFFKKKKKKKKKKLYHSIYQIIIYIFNMELWNIYKLYNELINIL